MVRISMCFVLSTRKGYLERQKNEAVAAQNEAKDLALTNQGLRVDKRIMEVNRLAFGVGGSKYQVPVIIFVWGVL